MNMRGFRLTGRLIAALGNLRRRYPWGKEPVPLARIFDRGIAIIRRKFPNDPTRRIHDADSVHAP